MKLSSRTELGRIPDRGSHDWETINQILDAGFLASVGFCVDGQPFVIPTLYGRDGERLYLHGSAASQRLTIMRSAATRLGLRTWTARVFTLRVPRSKQLTHAAEEPRIFELPVLGI